MSEISNTHARFQLNSFSKYNSSQKLVFEVMLERKMNASLSRPVLGNTLPSALSMAKGHRCSISPYGLSINLQEEDITRITADPKLVKLWSWICRILLFKK